MQNNSFLLVFWWFSHIVPTGPPEAQLNKSAQGAQRDSVVVTGPQLHRIHLKIWFLYLETLKAVLTTFSIRFSEISEEKFCPIPK